MSNNKPEGVQSRSVLRRKAIQKGEPMPTFAQDQDYLGKTQTRDVDKFRREYLSSPGTPEAVFTRQEVAWLLERGTVDAVLADVLLRLYYDVKGRIHHGADHQRVEDKTLRYEIYRLKQLVEFDKIVEETAEELGRAAGAFYAYKKTA